MAIFYGTFLISPTMIFQLFRTVETFATTSGPNLAAAGIAGTADSISRNAADIAKKRRPHREQRRRHCENAADIARIIARTPGGKPKSRAVIVVSFTHGASRPSTYA